MRVVLCITCMFDVKIIIKNSVCISLVRFIVL
jgi:hypothetical protein